MVVVQEEAYRKVKEALADEDVKVFCGEESLCDVCEMDCVDVVLSCIVGIAGLKPAFRTVSCGTPLAIANKETLVVAGELIMRTAKEHNAPVIPVDSEHSAIFQCIHGENEKVAYIGQGRFAVLHYENIRDQRHFTIKKIIEWESREEQSQWREELSGLYSKIN